MADWQAIVGKVTVANRTDPGRLVGIEVVGDEQHSQTRTHDPTFAFIAVQAEASLAKIANMIAEKTINKWQSWRSIVDMRGFTSEERGKTFSTEKRTPQVYPRKCIRQTNPGQEGSPEND